MPNWTLSSSISIPLSTVSNAALRSNSINADTRPESVVRSISLRTLTTAVSVEFAVDRLTGAPEEDCVGWCRQPDGLLPIARWLSIQSWCLKFVGGTWRQSGLRRASWVEDERSRVCMSLEKDLVWTMHWSCLWWAMRAHTSQLLDQLPWYQDEFVLLVWYIAYLSRHFLNCRSVETGKRWTCMLVFKALHELATPSYINLTLILLHSRRGGGATFNRWMA